MAAHHEVQITLVALAIFDKVVAEFGVENLSPMAMRRNVVTGGLNRNQLLGQEFTIDSAALHPITARPGTFTRIR